MLLYLFWLLLPAVQTTGRAVTGAAAVALFGVGVLLDGSWLKAHGWRTLLRAVCAALMPVILRVFLARGGENGAGFYVQQAMFWFPVVFAGYARERDDSPPVALGAPASAVSGYRDHAHHHRLAHSGHAARRAACMPIPARWATGPGAKHRKPISRS